MIVKPVEHRKYFIKIYWCRGMLLSTKAEDFDTDFTAWYIPTKSYSQNGNKGKKLNKN